MGRFRASAFEASAQQAPARPLPSSPKCGRPVALAPVTVPGSHQGSRHPPALSSQSLGALADIKVRGGQGGRVRSHEKMTTKDAPSKEHILDFRKKMARWEGGEVPRCRLARPASLDRARYNRRSGGTVDFQCRAPTRPAAVNPGVDRHDMLSAFSHRTGEELCTFKQPHIPPPKARVKGGVRPTDVSLLPHSLFRSSSPRPRRTQSVSPSLAPV